MAFDPSAPGKAAGSSFRGRRFRLAMMAGSLIGLGALAFEGWLWSVWRSGEAPAARPVTPAATTARLPPYELPPPEPTYVNVPVTQEVPVEKSREPVAEAPAPPRPGPAVRQQPAYEPPKAIAWNVKTPELGMDWYVDGRRPQLAKGCALRPGATIVEAKLLTEIRSELGGQAIAEISADVHDVDGMGRLLIPQGTRVVGLYKRGGLDFQDRRLDFVWTEMTFPSGRQIALGEAAGMDAAGAMGVGGEVRTRWGELIATAALVTIFDAAQRGAVRNDNVTIDSLQRSASDTAGELGEEVTRRMLDWEPDILIRAGTQIRISPQKTIRVC
jgi:type IV secretory pathway VirB10-like protein